MNKTRGFEKISFNQFKKDTQDLIPEKYQQNAYEKIKLPGRATLHSAGYDIFSPWNIGLKPGEKQAFPTGLKVYMKNDEWLSVRVRSGHGFKYNIRLKNQVGVIDADYYDNPDNEGHIFIALQNEGDSIWEVQQGEAFAQTIFHKYLVVDNDQVEKNRQGGLGSTD